MEIFVSILYTQRFRRPYLFGLFGMARLELELVGISISAEHSTLSLFNSEYKMGVSDQYNDAGIFTMVPPSTYPLWTRYAEIVERVAQYLGLGDVTTALTIVTNGDPHQEAFMARILAETKRDVNASYRSLEQRLDEAAAWLPTDHYGIGSNFLRHIYREDQQPFDQEDKLHMFTSHYSYPHRGQTIHLQDRANQLRGSLSGY